MDRQYRRRSLVGPLILIAVGLLFLLGNLGLLGWSAWEILVRFWPIMLIAIGLEILFGRRSWLGSLVVLAIVAGIIGAVLLFAPVQVGFGSAASSETVSQPLEGAKRANIDLSFPAGTVRVSALSDSSMLVDGTAGLQAGEQVSRSFQVSGDTANYRLGTRSSGPGPFWNHGGAQDWNLKLNPEVPMMLRLNGGLGTADLDLSQLRVTNLNANLGVGRTTISMPSTGQVQATINGGVGEVQIMVPQGMAARLQVDAGLGGMSVPPGYRKENNTYTSPDYSTSDNKLDLRVKGGVGRISIRQDTQSTAATSSS